ncbi:oxidoreductase [Aphelenchoides avenae]|nr:oxidoreductase [Aphelenchus avenae]
MSSLSGKHAWVVITGASRGIGRELALRLAEVVANNSMFFLLARDVERLEDVKREIITRNPTICTEVVHADLGQKVVNALYVSELCRMIREAEELYAQNPFEARLVVHNAGTVGDITKTSSELIQEDDWHTYLQTNLISTIVLNNSVFNLVKAPLTIVNVTSLAAIKAFPSFTQYSVGKAAREAYFRSFATEHTEEQCRVLQYSPGPVDTDMHATVARESCDEGVRKLFQESREKKAGASKELHRELLSPEQTVQRLVTILEENRFDTGARIDYFD